MSFRWPEIKLPGSAKRRPEDSVELRAWVLAAVLVGEAAVLTSGYFGAVTGVLVPFLTVVEPDDDADLGLQERWGELHRRRPEPLLQAAWRRPLRRAPAGYLV